MEKDRIIFNKLWKSFLPIVITIKNHHGNCLCIICKDCPFILENGRCQAETLGVSRYDIACEYIEQLERQE